MQIEWMVKKEKTMWELGNPKANYGNLHDRMSEDTLRHTEALPEAELWRQVRGDRRAALPGESLTGRVVANCGKTLMKCGAWLQSHSGMEPVHDQPR
jgi:hypothetical protein